MADSILDSLLNEFFVEPVPARTRKLEFQHEVQRHAFLQRLLQRGIERNVELRIENVALVFDPQLRRLDRNRVGVRSERPGHQGQAQRRDQPQQAERAVRWRHATGGGEPRDPGGSALLQEGVEKPVVIVLCADLRWQELPSTAANESGSSSGTREASGWRATKVSICS